jgi:hypothetical protein
VSTLHCPRCQVPLPVEFAGKEDLAPCPGCGALLQAEVFPALFRPPALVNAGEKVMIEGEASCFYHPRKKAVVPCESCGRFLCALCDIELNDQHLCPSCLETGRKKGKLVNLQNQRTCYDRMALGVSILALLLWPMAPIIGAVVIYLVVRYWKASLSLVRPSKLRFVAAFILGASEVAGGVLFYYYLFSHP